MKNKLFIALLNVVLCFAISAGELCPSYKISGNGCNTKFNGVEFKYLPTVSIFATYFKSSCNRHDICYRTLGEERAICDSAFRADMKNKCDSQFNKWLSLGLNASCKVAANAGYYAVKGAGIDNYNTAQINVAKDNQSLISSVDSESCGMEPKIADIYSSNLLDFIASEFLQQKGREASVYEKFDMLKLYNENQAISYWESLVSQAISTISLTPPKAKYNKTSFGGLFKLDAASSTGDSPLYEWKINNENTSGTIYQKHYFDYPTFTETHYFKGYLFITSNNGKRDLKVVDDKLTIIGLCSNKFGTCNQIP